jgi:hypothetical protein
VRPVHYLLAACALGIIAILSPVFVATPQPSTIALGNPAAASDLGDLSAMRTIVTDTEAFVTSGDAAGAKARIKDFETAWDDAQPTLRPKNGQQWDAVDLAADKALDAVRKDAPKDQTLVSLAALANQLDHPGVMAAGVAVDTSGKPAPCEDMLRQLRAARMKSTLTPDVLTKVADLEAKGTERCNSDDDKRADAFFADAIKLTEK